MGQTEVTTPEHIRATCTRCQGQRIFRKVGGDTEALVAWYDCPRCPQRITLSLDPEV